MAIDKPIEPTKIWDKDGFEIPPKFFRGSLPFDDIRAYQDPPGFREFIEAARLNMTREAYCEMIRGDRNYEPCDCGQVHSTTEPLKFTTFHPDDVSDEQRRTVDEILRHADTTARPLYRARPPSMDGEDELRDAFIADRIRTHYRLQQSTIRPDDPIWTASGA